MGGVAVQLFDYASLTGNVAATARETAERIRERIRGQQVAIFDIGRDLIAMKEALGHGHFILWIEAEFGMTRRTAVNYMAVAERFGDKWETVSHLPQTTLYQLAAPSTPEDLVGHVVERIERGDDLKPVDVRFLVKDAKAAERERRKDEKRTPAQRAYKRKVVRDQDREEREREERLTRRKEAMAHLVTLISDKMGDDLQTFLSLIGEVDTWDLRRALEELEN